MTSSSPSSPPPTASSPGSAHELDLTNEICPFTFVRTKLALEELPIGATLRVLVDHAPAAHTIPRSATEWGQQVLAVTQLTPTTWAIDLQKRVR